MKTIRVCLSDILKEKDMTQKELSELTGIQPSQISMMCRDAGTSINKSYIEKIAEVLEIDDIRKLIVLEVTK